MVKDQQVRRLIRLMQKERTKAIAAAKAGMDEKTARKYVRLGKLPSEIKGEHSWRTREDPFADVWAEVKVKLEVNPGLEAKTLFMWLQRKYPGRFTDGQLRTLQRKVKRWRALEGPPKEVFFEQEHRAGELSQSDFTDMNLSYGLQDALWKLGGVPRAHRTDQLSAAVQKLENPEEFTRRYKALLTHYGLEGKKIQVGKPNENGDIEQRYYRFKKAVDQALMLRGSRDFSSRDEYKGFIERLLHQLNAGRRARLEEELKVLRRLPVCKLPVWKRLQVRVSSGSTIRVNHNLYSVSSRLIGEMVTVRVYAERLEVWYAQKCVENIPRLRGGGKHRIQYRHIIDWLVRKPGAFANYRYRDDLFPTSHFRMAYDRLKEQHTESKAAKEYLKILYIAAKEGEGLVDEALRSILELSIPVVVSDVEMIVGLWKEVPVHQSGVRVAEVDLGSYDELLSTRS